MMRSYRRRSLRARQLHADVRDRCPPDERSDAFSIRGGRRTRPCASRGAGRGRVAGGRSACEIWGGADPGRRGLGDGGRHRRSCGALGRHSRRIRPRRAACGADWNGADRRGQAARPGRDGTGPERRDRGQRNRPLPSHLKPPSDSGWPGWNFADDNGDLADCNGHGTEVAGVVAGPQGVAPEAGLVVLKVFSGSDGCRSARASAVLGAVDWAVTNREAWNIEAVNLSLADDSSHSAFCDTDDPAGAATFAAARAAGLAAVAASGNDGKSSGLPWPACFSNVAAVGMVYSASSGSVAWNGPPSCEDALSGPDIVPCASSSRPGLSMLVPDVGWTTTAAGGGRTAIFSGTSASAPAATGAVLLTRQARPLADPAPAFDLLRATGVPVLDNRTGRITPRLDLSAALNATTPIGSCGGAAIPDGTGETPR